MKSVVNCSVRNNIWVETSIPPHPKSRRDVIWVEAVWDVIWVEAVRDVICRKNITYLTARPFAQEPVFYQYYIPNGIRN